LPITPSGLGVRENLFVLMLAAPAIAVSETSALSLSLLAYAGSLFWSLVGGAVYVTLKERHHLAEVAKEDSLAEVSPCFRCNPTDWILPAPLKSSRECSSRSGVLFASCSWFTLCPSYR